MDTVHNPDGWSLDGDTIKSTRADSYLPLFRVEPLTPESDVRLVLAAPAMLAALKRVGDAFEKGRYPELQGVACDVWAVINRAEGR